MRFSVTKACGGGSSKARKGLLHSAATGAIETPALLLSTRRGLPAFISLDLLSALPLPDSLLLHSSPLNFYEVPPLKTISNIGGLHQMVGLPEHVFVAIPRDSIDCLPDSRSTNKLGASFNTPSGRRLVKPTEYVEVVSSLKPDLWVTLPDEVPAQVSKKRNKASVDRTLRWLDDCLAMNPAGSLTALGAIVGGSVAEERRYCATEVSRRNVSGFWIGGFGLGESMEECQTLLNAVTDNLPEEKLRVISGLGLPEEVLQGVAAGIDLFDSSYIYHLTLEGFALVFPFGNVERDMDPDLYKTNDCLKINLRATIYRKDTFPIVENCRCFTCQNHSRAYINHLLNVHEMLAQILLEIHNAHHYIGFFHSIRDAIKSEKFELFSKKFTELR